MIIVKHPSKEKVYIYESENDYYNAVFNLKKTHLASFYFKWGFGQIISISMKYHSPKYKNVSEKILNQLNDYFLNYSLKQFLPVSFNVPIETFLSGDFNKVIEIKRLLKIS